MGDVVVRGVYQAANSPEYEACLLYTSIEFAVEQICGLPSDGNTKELVISKYKNIKS